MILYTLVTSTEQIAQNIRVLYYVNSGTQEGGAINISIYIGIY
jgi:hypothetical protein